VWAVAPPPPLDWLTVGLEGALKVRKERNRVLGTSHVEHVPHCLTAPLSNHLGIGSQIFPVQIVSKYEIRKEGVRGYVEPRA